MTNRQSILRLLRMRCKILSLTCWDSQFTVGGIAVVGSARYLGDVLVVVGSWDQWIRSLVERCCGMFGVVEWRYLGVVALRCLVGVAFGVECLLMLELPFVVVEVALSVVRQWTVVSAWTVGMSFAAVDACPVVRLQIVVSACFEVR